MNDFIQQAEKRLLDEYGCSNIDEVLIKQKQILGEDKNGEWFSTEDYKGIR